MRRGQNRIAALAVAVVATDSAVVAAAVAAVPAAEAAVVDGALAAVVVAAGAADVANLAGSTSLKERTETGD